MSKLAIYGGEKVRKEYFPSNSTIGKEELAAVKKVLESGILSRFLGCWHDDFFGGPEVRSLEAEWAKYFKVKHAVAVNSATSGLYCAVGAAELGPGDEVIVSPYTMAASATAPLIYNAIPVFADIEEDYFCLSPESIEDRITQQTKAIIVVDIFGQVYNADRINAIARKHNLVIIEDCAQAPGATYRGKYAGTLGDIGVFSLNYHKHIHSGEGGIVVTDNDIYADRIRLIRNHAEAVVGAKGYASLVNMIGFNYRMTELEASICRAQLAKLSSLIEARIKNIDYISKGLSTIPCITPTEIRPDCKHVFYQHPLKYIKAETHISRERFIEAVKAELMPTDLRETEGVKVGSGYVKPLYLEPLFQKRIAFGKNGCPWNCEKYLGTVDYSKGICPIAENLHFETLFTHELIHPAMGQKDLDDVVDAFDKVWKYREDLS